MTAQISKDKTSLDRVSNGKPVLLGEIAPNRLGITEGMVVSTNEAIQSVPLTGRLHDRSNKNHETKDVTYLSLIKINLVYGKVGEQTLTLKHRIKDVVQDKSNTVEPRASIEDLVHSKDTATFNYIF